jgi:hypothetical protein
VPVAGNRTSTSICTPGSTVTSEAKGPLKAHVAAGNPPSKTLMKIAPIIDCFFIVAPRIIIFPVTIIILAIIVFIS